MTHTSYRQNYTHAHSIAHTFNCTHIQLHTHSIAHTLKSMKCMATLVFKIFGLYFTCIILCHYIYLQIISGKKLQIILCNKINWSLNFDFAFFDWSILFKYCLSISSNINNL